MHLRFIATGWDKELDEMERWLGTRSLKMPYTDKKGKKKTILVPSYLRPIRMYDMIFPREHLHSILNTLEPVTEIALFDGKGTKVFKNRLTWLRRLFKLKKIPKADKAKGFLSHPLNLFKNIRIVGVGIKEDIDFVNPIGNTQEGL